MQGYQKPQPTHLRFWAKLKTPSEVTVEYILDVCLYTPSISCFNHFNYPFKEKVNWLHNCFFTTSFEFCFEMLFLLQNSNLFFVKHKAKKKKSVIRKIKFAIYSNFCFGHNISWDKIFVTCEKFRHFCQTLFCPIRHHHRDQKEKKL